MKFTYNNFLDIVFVGLLLALIVSSIKLIAFPIDQDIFAFIFAVFAIVYLALRLSGKHTSK